MRFFLGALLLAGCQPTVEEVDEPDDATLQCADQCDGDSECLIGGLGARCVDGQCEIDDIDGQPACSNDTDCNLLIAMFTGTKEFRCERSSECVAPGYSGPCIVGHSSGVAFCGLPYFGICNSRLVAREKSSGDTELCSEARAVCVAGKCHAPSTACVDQECTCAQATDCDPLYVSSRGICVALE